MANDKIIPKDEVEEIEVVTLSRYESANSNELSYHVHDNLTGPTGDDYYVLVDEDGNPIERNYPTMTQGPWSLMDEAAEDFIRYNRGFTNLDLTRSVDYVMPGKGRTYFVKQDGTIKKDKNKVVYSEVDNTDEITPREYQVSIMNVNSYRNTKQNTHVDYQYLDSYLDKYPEYEDEIRRRAQVAEELEVP